MSDGRTYVEGDLYLSVETVADVYRVEVVWLREVIDAGLLGTEVGVRPAFIIAAVRLDRVARIVRLHRALGFDLDQIRDALEDAEAAW
ncbi:MAG: hypothetical protein K8T90_10960 [Planctomycetes bacterium]|nr:hypothetical protein [Planctomycetota bacterium]